MRAWFLGLVALGASVVAACGGSAENNSSASGGRNTGGMSASGARDSGGTGGRATGGVASTTGGTSVGTGGTVDAGDLDRDDAITDLSTTSGGDCTNVTLGEVMVQLRESHPELEDIQNLWDPKDERAFDGSFIYAFTSGGGFRIVAVRGWDDCQSGCINKEYWYFETAEKCSLKQVGHYSLIFASAGNCFEVTGSPLWGFPGAPPPGACGEDPTPRDVSGVHEIAAVGLDTACSRNTSTQEKVMRTLRLEVAQDSTLPGTASVTIEGTGLNILDGSMFNGSVTGSVLTVSTQVTTPAQGDDCGGMQNVSLSYDFTRKNGTLNDEYLRYTDCAKTDYCKGMLQLMLTQ